MELAVRGAVFTVIAALPFFIPQLNYLTSTGIYNSSAVLMMIFTMYKTVGETIYLAYVGMTGTFIAALNIWVLFGLQPGGCTFFTPASVWYIGMADGLIFTLLMLWLNVDNCCRMFA